jgi:hypothetical protein
LSSKFAGIAGRFLLPSSKPGFRVVRAFEISGEFWRLAHSPSRTHIVVFETGNPPRWLELRHVCGLLEGDDMPARSRRAATDWKRARRR